MSSVYGAGYVFHGGDERDQIIKIDRPVFAPLATPSSTLRAQRYALTLVPGNNITMVHSEVDANNTVLVAGGSLLLVRSTLHDVELPLEMTGPEARVVISDSAFGSGYQRQFMPLRKSRQSSRN